MLLPYFLSSNILCIKACHKIRKHSRFWNLILVKLITCFRRVMIYYKCFCFYYTFTCWSTVDVPVITLPFLHVSLQTPLCIAVHIYAWLIEEIVYSKVLISNQRFCVPDCYLDFKLYETNEKKNTANAALYCRSYIGLTTWENNR